MKAYRAIFERPYIYGEIDGGKYHEKVIVLVFDDGMTFFVRYRENNRDREGVLFSVFEVEEMVGWEFDLLIDKVEIEISKDYFQLVRLMVSGKMKKMCGNNE